MTEENKELITKLKIIGQAKKGYKLNTRTMQYQRAYSVFEWFTRSFVNVNSRDDTMRLIKSVVNQALETLQHKTDKDDQMSKFVAQTLITDLLQAQHGITEIQETYADDIEFWCTLKTQSDFISAHIKSLRDRRPDLFHTTADTATGSESPILGNEKKNVEQL